MKTQGEIGELLKIKALRNYINEKHTQDECSGYIDGYTQCQEDMADNSKVTRFEVIDENGRAYTKHNCKIELSYQDDGRTLKVFIKPLNKQD